MEALKDLKEEEEENNMLFASGEEKEITNDKE